MDLQFVRDLFRRRLGTRNGQPARSPGKKAEKAATPKAKTRAPKLAARGKSGARHKTAKRISRARPKVRKAARRKRA